MIRTWAWATVLLTVALQTPTWATTVQVLPVERLAETSSHVVRAEVQSIESFWNQDKSVIFTRVVLRSERVLRGDDVPGEFTLLLPGGTVEGKTTIIVGAPEFKPRQHVVLFLNKITEPQEGLGLTASQMGGYQLADLIQGMFEVTVDPATGESTAVSNVLKLVQHDQTEQQVLALGPLEGLSLEELETRIRQAP